MRAIPVSFAAAPSGAAALALAVALAALAGPGCRPTPTPLTPGARAGTPPAPRPAPDRRTAGAPAPAVGRRVPARGFVLLPDEARLYARPTQSAPFMTVGRATAELRLLPGKPKRGALGGLGLVRSKKGKGGGLGRLGGGRLGAKKGARPRRPLRLSWRLRAVRGALDERAVREHLRYHFRQARSCVSRWRGRSAPQGELGLDLRIAPDGSVQRARLSRGRGTPKMPGVSKCLTQRIRRFAFPQRKRSTQVKGVVKLRRPAARAQSGSSPRRGDLAGTRAGAGSRRVARSRPPRGARPGATGASDRCRVEHGGRLFRRVARWGDWIEVETLAPAGARGHCERGPYWLRPLRLRLFARAKDRIPLVTRQVRVAYRRDQKLGLAPGVALRPLGGARYCAPFPFDRSRRYGVTVRLPADAVGYAYTAARRLPRPRRAPRHRYRDLALTADGLAVRQRVRPRPRRPRPRRPRRARRARRPRVPFFSTTLWQRRSTAQRLLLVRTGAGRCVEAEFWVDRGIPKVRPAGALAGLLGALRSGKPPAVPPVAWLRAGARLYTATGRPLGRVRARAVPVGDRGSEPAEAPAGARTPPRGARGHPSRDADAKPDPDRLVCFGGIWERRPAARTVDGALRWTRRLLATVPLCAAPRDVLAPRSKPPRARPRRVRPRRARPRRVRARRVREESAPTRPRRDRPSRMPR
jgi:hypothetical protein